MVQKIELNGEGEFMWTTIGTNLSVNVVDQIFWD